MISLLEAPLIRTNKSPEGADPDRFSFKDASDLMSG